MATILKTLAAALLATSMVAGASLAAQPSGTNGQPPAATTSSKTHATAKPNATKHVRTHRRTHHVRKTHAVKRHYYKHRVKTHHYTSSKMRKHHVAHHAKLPKKQTGSK